MTESRPPSTAPMPEMPRPVVVERLDDRGLSLDIEAEADERAALARRFGLAALARLTAHVHLESAGKGVVRLEGELSAQLTQSCVVTLAPVEASINTRFKRHYAQPGAAGEGAEVVVDDAGTADDPADPIMDGQIDAGEAVAEALALEIDPFPRAPGSRFEGFSSNRGGPEGGGEGRGAFAALAHLRKKRK